MRKKEQKGNCQSLIRGRHRQENLKYIGEL